MTGFFRDNGTAWVNLRTAAVDTTQPPTSARFPGDPGKGNYYVGWAEGPGDWGNLTYGKSKTSKLAMLHTYSGDAAMGVSSLDRGLNAGLIASNTFRFTVRPAQVKAGAADAAIDTMASQCAARDPKPIWLCYAHEPESKYTTAVEQADYRAAYRRVIQRFRTAGVTNVAWQMIYMNPWTFQAASGRDWRNYHCDWTGTGWQSTILIDMMGMDTYNPFPGATKNWAFDVMFDQMRALVEKPGYPRWPYTQPEFGMGRVTNDWAAWCRTARDYAKSNDIINFTYWDNAADIGRYDLDTFDPAYGTPQSKNSGWQVLNSAAKTYVQPV